MFKTFLFGILLGLVAAGGVLYAIPVVDQHREVSHISVAPNGANRESFRINIPDDRIIVGAAEGASMLPVDLQWPEADVLAGVSTEMFKLRNERDVVIGVAARTVTAVAEAEAIDWVLHLPARGSLYVGMSLALDEGGQRLGDVRAGTREFEFTRGNLAEGWVADVTGAEDAPDGRIELLASFHSIAEQPE